MTTKALSLSLPRADTIITFFTKQYIVHSSILKANSKLFAKENIKASAFGEYTYHWVFTVSSFGQWRHGSAHEMIVSARTTFKNYIEARLCYTI
jgi:hypothetical protein